MNRGKREKLSPGKVKEYNKGGWRETKRRRMFAYRTTIHSHSSDSWPVSINSKMVCCLLCLSPSHRSVLFVERRQAERKCDVLLLIVILWSVVLMRGEDSSCQPSILNPRKLLKRSSRANRTIAVRSVGNFETTKRLCCCRTTTYVNSTYFH